MSLLIVAGCGDDDTETGRSTASSDDGDGPQVVVTTSILGDIVGEVLAGEADVTTLMPPGADPHGFSLSLSEASDVMEADLLVVNGFGFEEGLVDVIEQARDEGVEVFTFADHVGVLESEDEDHGDEDHEEEDHADDDHDDEHDHADEDHGDEDHEEEDHADDEDQGEADHDEHGHEGHDHGPEDPHIWTDPTRMVSAVDAFTTVAGELDGADAETVEGNGASYVDELTDLDTEIDDLLADVGAEDRVLVTNHEVFAYFADRYNFEIVGTVIPSTSSRAEASQQELEDLVDVIGEHDVPAIFTEVSEDADRAETVAGEAGDVEVVELYGESLGDEGSDSTTYLDMMRTNATRIAEALR